MGELKWRMWTSWHPALIDKGGQGAEERFLPLGATKRGRAPVMLTWQPVGWLIALAKLQLLLLLLPEVCRFSNYQSAVIRNFNC